MEKDTENQDSHSTQFYDDYNNQRHANEGYTSHQMSALESIENYDYKTLQNSLFMHMTENANLSNQVKRLATALINCQNQGIKDIQELEARYIKITEEITDRFIKEYLKNEDRLIKINKGLEAKYIKQKKEFEDSSIKFKDEIIVLKENNEKIKKDLRLKLEKLDADRILEVHKLKSQIEEDKISYDRALNQQKKSYDDQIS